MSNIVDKLAKKEKAERKLHLRRLVFASLESLWEQSNFLASMGRMPENEAMEVVSFAFDCFVAEIAIGDGVSREDFLREMGEAYDESKQIEENGEETVEEEVE